MLNFYTNLLETEKEKILIGDLYTKNKILFLRYALKITNNREMAEDAVHNAFISIIEHKKTLLSMTDRDVLRWCVVIVKNKAIDQLRSKKRLDVIPIEEIEFAIPSDEEATENIILKNELYSALYRHLDSLDIMSRQILEMKYCFNMSYKEIALKLHVSEKYIDNHIMLAKTKLRRLVKDEVNKIEF